MNEKKLKKMFPHIPFHADRVKAFHRWNEMMNRNLDEIFLRDFEPSFLMVGKVETASWESFSKQS